MTRTTKPLSKEQIASVAGAYGAWQADGEMVSGGNGKDVIFTWTGDDTLDGGGGDDYIFAGGGNDLVSGGDGMDQIDGEQGDDTLDGGAGKDFLEGGEGDDLLRDGAGSDFASGNAGNDTFEWTPSGCHDIFNGGYDYDTVVVPASPSDVQEVYIYTANGAGAANYTVTEEIHDGQPVVVWNFDRTAYVSITMPDGSSLYADSFERLIFRR